MSNCSGVTTVSSRGGTVGVLTPLHGCKKVTWSFSAVVKTALRMLFRVRMFVALTPAWVRCLTHSRTSAGMIWFIRRGPNHGMMCLPIE